MITSLSLNGYNLTDADHPDNVKRGGVFFLFSFLIGIQPLQGMELQEKETQKD